MKFRWIIMFCILLTLPVSFCLNNPTLGNYTLIFLGFYAFAEANYFLVVLILLLFVLLFYLLIKRKDIIFDILLTIIAIIDFVICFVVLLNEFNYVAAQSVIFDILYLALIYICKHQSNDVSVR